jgi:hypothetical protein
MTDQRLKDKTLEQSGGDGRPILMAMIQEEIYTEMSLCRDILASSSTLRDHTFKMGAV